MKKLLLGMATLAVATAAGAFGPSERRAKEMAAYTPVGEAVNCVDIQQIDSTNILDNKTIDFRMRGGKVYRNTLPYSCSGLMSEDRFLYRTSLSRLCNVDIIHVLHDFGGRLQEGAGCGLGKFQPMEKAAQMEDASYTDGDWVPFEVVDKASATN